MAVVAGTATPLSSSTHVSESSPLVATRVPSQLLSVSDSRHIYRGSVMNEATKFILGAKASIVVESQLID